MLLNVPELCTTDWWWKAGVINYNCFRIFTNDCKTIHILNAHYLVLGKKYEHSRLTKRKYMLPWQLWSPYQWPRCEPTASNQLMVWSLKGTGGKTQTWWPSTSSCFISSRLDHVFPLGTDNSGRENKAYHAAEHFLAFIRFYSKLIHNHPPIL